MKDKIHPAYKETTIACVCGAVIHTRSTKQNIHVDICSNCHPFFTGKQKLIDSAGRVEKFAKRYAGKVKPKKAEAAKTAKEKTAEEVKAKPEAKLKEKPEANLKEKPEAKPETKPEEKSESGPKDTE